MKVRVDLAKCTGHARCSALAPDVFENDDVEGKAIVVRPEISLEMLSTALRGAKGCPELAITIVDETTGKTIWPADSAA